MRNWRWLLPLVVAAGCTGGGATTQVLEGRLSGSGAVVRAVRGTTVVAAAQVATDGSWTLALPKGDAYRLEVLGTDGAVHAVVARGQAGATTLSFSVCEPQDPFDVGGVGDTGMGMGSGSGGCNGGGDPPPPPPGCDPMTDPDCKCDAAGNCYPPPPPPCDPSTDPSCMPPPPPPCSDPSDPSCTKCDPMTGVCCDVNGVCCDADGNCTSPPPPCDPSTDPGCMPPPGCDPSTDPDCKCDASGNCDPPPPPCTDPSDPNCMPPPPPCTDPSDPSCKDPCMIDPMSCGCAADDPKCWPDPQPPPCDANGVCDPSGTMAADHAPGDFGCQGGG